VRRNATGAEFDSFAANYEELHARSVRITGEEPEYFAAYKASYVARRLTSGVTRVLDYGCGIGMLSRQLKLHLPQAQIDGFDPSRDSLGRMERALLTQGVFTSDPNKLRRDYDAIIIANVLHHVKPPNRQDLVSGAVSRLSPGGKLVIFEHNPANPLTRWAVAQCEFDGDATLLWPGETKRYVERDRLHVDCEYVVFFPRWLAPMRRFEPRLCWCPLGAQYVIVGSRP
jgi:2-polyprenyl-3-methyl-5-hydroxy-6-metoxy-1,4-benzoquinol methylase